MAGVLLGPGLLLADVTAWLLPAAILALVSFFDDWRGMPIAVRFLIHFFTAALFVVSASLRLDYFWFSIVILAVVWITNLYNFMDGSDGLAGGMALLGFGSYGVAAWLNGDLALALTSVSVTTAAAVFLVFNFYPARIFMGDAGSIPLGFLAAAFGLIGWQRGLWPLWFPVLIFSPFIIDASMTLLKRALRREKIWHAHREHYYQRLVQMGWGHRKTALAEYGVMTAAGLTGLGGLTQGTTVQVGLCVVWIAFYAVLMALLDKRWTEFSTEGRSR